MTLQFCQHCNIIDKIISELKDTTDEDWNRKIQQLKEMDEQIYIRDKLIKDASLKLKKLKISSLFTNSMLVKDPYGLCAGELSDAENYSRKINISKANNNSLPQLAALKHREEQKGMRMEFKYLDKIEEDKELYTTPKNNVIAHQKSNSSFDSPYLQKKQEIDDVSLWVVSVTFLMNISIRLF